MPWPRRKKKNPESNYDSGLEEQVAQQLKDNGIAAEYEPVQIPYVRKSTFYKPDFVLPNGIIVETKGWFQSKDRSKHLLVKKQHPDLDIRFVFSNPKSKIGKRSTTTYGGWCDMKGFQYSPNAYIPPAWLRETPNEASLAALRELMETKTK